MPTFVLSTPPFSQPQQSVSAIAQSESFIHLFIVEVTAGFIGFSQTAVHILFRHLASTLRRQLLIDDCTQAAPLQSFFHLAKKVFSELRLIAVFVFSVYPQAQGQQPVSTILQSELYEHFSISADSSILLTKV